MKRHRQYINGDTIAADLMKAFAYAARTGKPVVIVHYPTKGKIKIPDHIVKSEAANIARIVARSLADKNSGLG